MAVVSGGSSSEAAFSRSSGAAIAGALRSAGYGVVEVELDSNLADHLRDLDPAAVFPMLHGVIGEDGCVQGLLEVLGIPYVGSDVLASALGMDKAVAKRVWRAHGLPVAQDVIVSRGSDISAALSQAIEELGDETVVKPTREGAAVGVIAATGSEELASAVASLVSTGADVLIERRINGLDLTVAILEDPVEPRALPIVQMIADSNRPGRLAGPLKVWDHRVVPAPLSATVREAVVDLARRAHKALGCRDLSRVDLMLSDSGPILIEINTLPGLSPQSLYVEAADADGIGIERLATRLVGNALQRGSLSTRHVGGLLAEVV